MWQSDCDIGDAMDDVNWRSAILSTRCNTIWLLRCQYAMNDVTSRRSEILRTWCNNIWYADMRRRADPIIFYDGILITYRIRDIGPFQVMLSSLLRLNGRDNFMTLIWISYRVWNYMFIAISVKPIIGDSQ